jgi:hypothetical protein
MRRFYLCDILVVGVDACSHPGVPPHPIPGVDVQHVAHQVGLSDKTEQVNFLFLVPVCLSRYLQKNGFHNSTVRLKLTTESTNHKLK